MELTCNRCHQTVEAEDCFCPICGLPQIVFSAEGNATAGQPERWPETVRDAGTVNWKPALKLSLVLAIPAGILCAEVTRVGPAGVLLVPFAAAWAVALYVRNQQPSWITVGAGARIGLVTGILASWTAALTLGFALYAQRYWMRQGSSIDNFWATLINQLNQQWASMGIDAQTIAAYRALLQSPEGRAGYMLSTVGFLACIILVFAVAGGALGARFLGRPRRPQN